MLLLTLRLRLAFSISAGISVSGGRRTPCTVVQVKRHHGVWCSVIVGVVNESPLTGHLTLGRCSAALRQHQVSAGDLDLTAESVTRWLNQLKISSARVCLAQVGRGGSSSALSLTAAPCHYTPSAP